LGSLEKDDFPSLYRFVGVGSARTGDIWVEGEFKTIF
jgi:hypothetical protein